MDGIVQARISSYEHSDPDQLFIHIKIYYCHLVETLISSFD